MFKKPLLPGIIWAFIIALLTLLPGCYIPKVTSLLDWLSPDKLVHLFLFGIFVILYIEGFSRQMQQAVLRKYAVGFSMLIGMVFAVLTEAMQKYIIPGRNGNIYDFLADLLGLLLGYMLWRLIRRNGKKNLLTFKKYN